MSENRSQNNFESLNSFINQNNQINELENNINNLDINNLPTKKEDQEQKPSTNLSEEIPPTNKSTKKYKFIVVKEENQKQNQQNQQIHQQNNAQIKLNQSNMDIT